MCHKNESNLSYVKVSTSYKFGINKNNNSTILCLVVPFHSPNYFRAIICSSLKIAIFTGEKCKAIRG